MKKLPWFYLPKLDARPGSAVLAADESRHLARSRRLRIGSEIVVFNGLGTTATAKIVDISERRARVALEMTAYAYHIEGRVRVHLAAALPKGDRQVVMLDMATQIGMTDFTPLLCEHSVAKFSVRSAARWQKTCLEACKQSRRPWVPRLHQPKQLPEMFNTGGKAGRVTWLADPRGGNVTAVQKVGFDELILLVGPEGGFSPGEWELLSHADIVPVTLAKSVLRTETAAVAMVSAAVTRLGI
jgi:16S rRNA (uracil1498-N3)-methyltransferase